MELMISIQHVEENLVLNKKRMSPIFSHCHILTFLEVQSFRAFRRASVPLKVYWVEACENTGTCEQLEAWTANMFPWGSF